VSIKQREELELMSTPATATIIAVAEAALGEFQQNLSAERFGIESCDVSTGQASDAEIPRSAKIARSCRVVQIHTPFGVNVATHLEQVHSLAWRWTGCHRKMGFFRMMAAPAGVTGDDEFAHYRAQVMDTWAFPDLTPDGDHLKAVWVGRCEQLLSKLPENTDGEHARWLEDALQSAR
jgi:hypothetical protein